MKKLLRPTIIDVEASGFGPESYPIEVGVAMPFGERHSFLILPVPEWVYWDREAEKVHHVTREVLEEHGRPIGEVTDKLNDLLGDRLVYSDGWVVDKAWITQLFYTAGVNQRFVVSPIESILNERQMEHWHETKNEIIKKENFKRHRASIDAFIVQETFMKTREGSL